MRQQRTTVPSATVINFSATTGLIAAACTTFSFLPQAIRIIRTKDTKAISLLMTVGTAMWLLFGVLTQNIPVMAANGVTLVFAAIILLYKIRFK